MACISFQTCLALSLLKKVCGLLSEMFAHHCHSILLHALLTDMTIASTPTSKSLWFQLKIVWSSENKKNIELFVQLAGPTN